MVNPDIIPADEKERIKALKRYEILDTPPDGSFDHITAIAARLFGVPIALVTLVDEDRIWFKAKYGLEVDQIDREPGLCASAILSPEVHNVADTLHDVRTLANPLVAGDFGLRFYAGAPLKTKDGYNLGTLCVLDMKPKQLTESELEILEDLAGVVMDEMELRIAALKATRELQAHKDELEAVVKKRTAELEKANSELRRSNSDLEQFAYVSSHDLKEPLRMVSIYAHLLSDRFKETLNEEGTVYLGYLMEGAGRIQMLIKDLLNYFHAGQANPELAEVDLNEVLEEVKGDLRNDMQEHEAVIRTGGLPVLHGNYAQWKTVFHNLVENALKFKGQNKPVIEINAVQEEGSWLFSVKDNGMGLGRKYQDVIFQLFQRLQKEVPGTGIGLPICKKMIESWGGRIWVESDGETGSTFYFTVPVTV